MLGGSGEGYVNNEEGRARDSREESSPKAFVCASVFLFAASVSWRVIRRDVTLHDACFAQQSRIKAPPNCPARKNVP